MKLVAFGVAAVAALLGTPAFAADIVFPSPPPSPPGWSFTGCYIGANIGAGWGASNVSWTNISDSSTLRSARALPRCCLRLRTIL